MAELEASVADHVLTLRLNRPRAHNAITDSLADDLAARLERAVSEDDVRVVVLTGTGASFSAGADLTQHESLDVSALERANRIVRAIVGLDKPVVAGVNGVAAGFGAALVLAADLAVVKESAGLLVAFTRVGLMPDGGATATIAAAIGRPRALRMALLAEPLRARAAYAAGLVSHVAADEEYAATLADVVRRLAAGPPLALAATKRAVNAAALAGLDDALERERLGQSLLLRTSDATEGMRAFGEKRRPAFRGE